MSTRAFLVESGEARPEVSAVPALRAIRRRGRRQRTRSRPMPTSSALISTGASSGAPSPLACSRYNWSRRTARHRSKRLGDSSRSWYPIRTTIPVRTGRPTHWVESPRPARWDRPRPGLSADRAHLPLCFVPIMAGARPDVRRRMRRGGRPDADAGPRTAGRGAGNGRAMTLDRTRLAERRLPAGTRGRSRGTPLSGAAIPPGASGASASPSATHRTDGLGLRSRSQPGSRENSASSHSRRPGFQIGSRALCTSLVRDDCRIGG